MSLTKHHAHVKPYFVAIQKALKVFEEYWFERKAEATNDALTAFDVTFHEALPAFTLKDPTSNQRSIAIIHFYHMLELYDENKFKAIFRLPSPGSEQTEKLVASRAEALSTWHWLRTHFDYVGFFKAVPNAVEIRNALM